MAERIRTRLVEARADIVYEGWTDEQPDVRKLVDSPEFLGIDGITRLIYGSFTEKATILSAGDPADNPGANILESLWVTSERLATISKVIERGKLTRIKQTSKNLVPSSDPTLDRETALKRDIIEGSGAWYALDEKLRHWLKVDKWQQLLSSRIKLNSDHDFEDFWTRQLMVRSNIGGRNYSSYCPDIILAAKVNEERAISAMQALGGEQSDSKPFDDMTLYLVGSLPFWEFTGIPSKEDGSGLKSLRKRILKEVSQNGRPRPKTLTDLSSAIERLPHAIPQHMGTVISVLETKKQRKK